MTMQSVPGWAFQIPAGLGADLEEFGDLVQRFKSGGASEAQFRAYRVPMGVYEQRESGTYMLRVRLPAGGLLPEQMRCLARVAHSFGNGVLHVTTRQDIQVHRVPLDAICPALAALAESGLASKGGGGNTVRNISSCCNAGVCHDEAFDVAPYAIAVTERLMEDTLSFQLPRKYKVAFSGCSSDCSGATVNDVGFIARQQNGLDGFAVYVGGGMGNRSRVSDLLDEFVVASDAYLVTEAVKRVFDKNGDRKNKNQARLRFLVERIGLEAFRELYEAEFAALRASAPAPLRIRPFPQSELVPNARKTETNLPDAEEYVRWLVANVQPQKQSGFHRVEIPLPLGDIDAATMTALADVIGENGDGLLWAKQAQNLSIRWLAKSELPTLCTQLKRLGLATGQPRILRNLVACAGASTCRLGICLSRGLAKSLSSSLLESDINVDKIGDVRIHISGCPNSCGRHLVADIGLHGAARRIGTGLVPHYTVSLGGRTREGQTRLAEGCGTIPAKNVPAFVTDLLRQWTQATDNTDIHDYLDSNRLRITKELADRYRQPPTPEQERNVYSDWDSDEPFSLAGRGPGECSAGVFDLIEVDLATSRESLDAGKLYTATVSAARALLVTRGEQPKTEVETLRLFQKYFVEEGLVDQAFADLIKSATAAAITSCPEGKFEASVANVTIFVASVKLLYESMDASLRFKSISLSGAIADAPTEAPAASIDLRGVACPLNYVKTKMALAKLRSGQELSVLLDGQGAKNVPESAVKDGHRIKSQNSLGNHWQLLICKQ